MKFRNGEPLCLIGDFNYIRNEDEKRNCSYRSRDSVLFNNFIQKECLWEVPLAKFQFTWHGPANKVSRLDRAFVNCHWPSHSTWVLHGDSRKSLDHISLLLKANNINWGPIPFKAYNFWLEDEQFLQWIDEKLKSSKKLPPNTQLQSWRIFRSWIKEWSKEHKFDFSLKISTLESKLSLAEQADRSLKEKMAISRELIHSYKVRDSVTM